MPQTSSKSDSNRFVFEPTRKPWLRRLSANGQYYLWWKHNNKRHQFKLNTDNYATAVARGEDEIQKLKAQDQSPLVNDGKIALGDLLEHFLKSIHRQVESKQLKQTSYEAIVDGVNKIKRERADWLARPAAKIADKEIDDYVHGLRTTQSPTTVNRVVDVLRRSYSLAVDERLLFGNPTLKLKRAKLRAVKTDEIPTEEQYQQLLAEIRNGKLSHKWHVIDLVEFLSNYGCRIKEARNILKSDVDLEGRTHPDCRRPRPRCAHQERKRPLRAHLRSHPASHPATACPQQPAHLRQRGPHGQSARHRQVLRGHQQRCSKATHPGPRPTP